MIINKRENSSARNTVQDIHFPRQEGAQNILMGNESQATLSNLKLRYLSYIYATVTYLIL